MQMDGILCEQLIRENLVTEEFCLLSKTNRNVTNSWMEPDLENTGLARLEGG